MKQMGVWVHGALQMLEVVIFINVKNENNTLYIVDSYTVHSRNKQTFDKCNKTSVNKVLLQQISPPPSYH